MTATATVSSLLQTLGRKVEVTDLLSLDEPTKTAVREVVTSYATSYQGTFEYMLKMREQVRRQPLTVGMVKGVLNCWRAEQARRQPAELPTGQPVPDGYYTVVKGTGHVTLRLKEWAKEAGTQIAAFMNGSCNTSDYEGFAFVTGTRARVWKRYQGPEYAAAREALQVLLSSGQAEEYGQAYALESGKCYLCNRLLTTPESLAVGLGPDCRKRVAA